MRKCTREKMAKKKYYGLAVSKVKKEGLEKPYATGVLKGYITKKSDMTLHTKGDTKWVNFSMNIQNQGKNLEYVAEQLGAKVNHIENEDDVLDVVKVSSFGGGAELFGKRKVNPGDEVTVFVDFTTNEYNGNVSLQATNAVLVDVRHRKTTDVDATATETAPTETVQEPVVEATQPVMDFSDEDVPF